MSLLKINEQILSLYELYDDEECRGKLLEFIQKDLTEKMLLFWEKKERFKTLKNLSDTYINDFLQNNEMQYFYIPNSAIYISYNGEEFKLINESELLHQILTGISQNKTLLPWKQKIKIKIMKIIKEKNIFETIPESHTIQNVINHITPLILQTKDEAKYFLTILGDNILKKNTDIYHILNNRGKDFITNLEENVYHYFKNSYHLNTSFKFSWHEHEYSKCRIINFNRSVDNSNYWRTFIKYHILDILSVAVHYSKRYGNSDEYILSKKETNPSFQTVLYLSDHNISNIVNDFIKENIISVENKDIVMTFNEILYIWKLYLAEKKLPNIIFIKNLKIMLKNTLHEKNDVYLGITSPSLFLVKTLHEFWKCNILTGESEFEISELCDLFKSWVYENKNKKEHVGEYTMVTLIQHFFNNEIINNKNIININCKLWDKQKQMKTVIDDIKISYNFSPEMFNKSIKSVYEEYCARSKSRFNYNIVSKKYFEKYLNKIIPQKFIIGKLISNDYWNS